MNIYEILVIVGCTLVVVGVIIFKILYKKNKCSGDCSCCHHNCK